MWSALHIGSRARRAMSVFSRRVHGGLLAVSDPNDANDPNDPCGDFVYFYDGNGNVGQVVDLAHDANDPAGAIVAKYEYDPYGQRINHDPNVPEYDQPWRFSTKQFDAETGLGYWGYRYYSPGLGRWISRDPIEEAGDANLYAYVSNCTTEYIDALGLFGGSTHRRIASTAWAAAGCDPSSHWARVVTERDVDTDSISNAVAEAPHAQSKAFLPLVQADLRTLKNVKCCGQHADLGAMADALGEIFHVLQDFYAHTDWIEGGSTPMLRLYIRHGYSYLVPVTHRHSAHAGTLSLELLEQGTESQIYNVHFYGGSGAGGSDASEHNAFGADAPGKGRARSWPEGLGDGAYHRAESRAVDQTKAIIDWARKNLDACCWNRLCGCAQGCWTTR